MPKQITAADLPHILRPGMRVAVPGGMGEPGGLIDLLREAPDAAAGVHFYQFPLPVLNSFDYSSLHRNARMCVPFMAPHLRAAHAEGRVRFMPMSMRACHDFFASAPTFDLLLLQVTPADDKGIARHGFNIDFIEPMIANSRCILAEVNAALIPPASAPGIALEQLDWLVETAHPLAHMPVARIDDTALEIGRLVADLIPDGACIQTGIGAIPAAVLTCLAEREDLGLHSGLIDDATMTLIRRGNINGSRKAIDRGAHIACMAIGSMELCEWLAHTPEVVLRGADYTHDVRVIAQLDNFCSVNSAIEIDLDGQVNAESVTGRQVSGTGGSVDFMRGAALSRGGRSILALASTARGGSLSRIVPCLSAGTPVTALRTDVDTVVTEYGVAELGNQPLEVRRERLIAIAAPEFRQSLARDERD